jgi:hypothetical protein
MGCSLDDGPCNDCGYCHDGDETETPPEPCDLHCSDDEPGTIVNCQWWAEHGYCCEEGKEAGK